MKTTSVVFLLFFTSFTYGQDSNYTIHISVGDTIDKLEKNYYYLFHTINDSLFKHAIYYQVNDSSFSSVVSMIDGKTVKNELTLLEVKMVQENINKFNYYYVHQAEKDSLSRYLLSSGMTDQHNNVNNMNNSMKLFKSKEHKTGLQDSYNNSSKHMNEVNDFQRRTQSLGTGLPPK